MFRDSIKREKVHSDVYATTLERTSYLVIIYPFREKVYYFFNLP